MGQYRSQRYKSRTESDKEVGDGEREEKLIKKHELNEKKERSREVNKVTEEEFLLKVKVSGGKYKRIFLSKKNLNKIGLVKAGLYKFTFRALNGEIIEVFRRVKKIDEVDIIIPRKYKGLKELKLIRYEEYTLEKIIDKLTKLQSNNKIKYRIEMHNGTLYLYLGKFKVKVDNYRLKSYGRALFLDVDVKASPNKELTLRIEVRNDSSNILIKKWKDTYFKVLDIKSDKNKAFLSFLGRDDKGNSAIRHIYFVSLNYYKYYNDIIQHIVSEITVYEFLGKYRDIKIYRYKITESGKELIDIFLDKTYEDYHIGKNKVGQEAKNIREELEIELAINFLASRGWEYKEKYIINPNLRKGFDLFMKKDTTGYLFEVKITEPSFKNKAIEKARREIRDQAYKFYKDIIDKFQYDIGYIGFIVITFHYSWRPLNEYKIYFWVEKYEKE